MADREPPSPLARNLLGMERPADIGSRILPPLVAQEETVIDRENLSDG
jgi:hypothetical protein